MGLWGNLLLSPVGIPALKVVYKRASPEVSLVLFVYVPAERDLQFKKKKKKYLKAIGCNWKISAKYLNYCSEL